jgi:hypothetical protein
VNQDQIRSDTLPEELSSSGTIEVQITEESSANEFLNETNGSETGHEISATLLSTPKLVKTTARKLCTDQNSLAYV